MKQGTGKSDLARQAEALAKDCAAFAEQLKQERGCLDVINEIVDLAVTNTKYIHINPDYQAHLHWP